MSNYKKYDDRIKEMIIKSGNPNLFPNLKIPRTTALYWINQAKKKIKLSDLDINKALENRIKKLEAELEKIRATSIFQQEVLKSLDGFSDLIGRKANRKKLVSLVNNYRKWNSVSNLCTSVCIRYEKYRRIQIQELGCERVAFNKCKIMASNQVTFREQEKIHQMARDPKLSHLSVKGLYFHGFRYENIYLSYDTWRKYINEFRRNLPLKKHKKKKKKGITSKRPNEVWHIDITEFKLKNGKKAYLQVLMDNYSRKILNWNLSLNKNQFLTLKNLKEAIRIARPKILLSDGGGENISFKVRKITMEKNITKLIAKKDVSFSNSMVESFFNILKNRFINKYQKLKFSKLFNQLKRSIQRFNQMVIPALNGATPIEVYDRAVCPKVLANNLSNLRSEWAKIRPEINRRCLRGNMCR